MIYDTFFNRYFFYFFACAYDVDKPLTDKAIAKGEENVVNFIASTASVGLVSKFVLDTDKKLSFPRTSYLQFEK